MQVHKNYNYFRLIMITATFKGVIYVGHSKGEYEGSKFNNVVISNGVEKIKIKNKVDTEILNAFEPEKSRVDITVELKGRKEEPALTLVKIEPAK